MPGIPFNPNVGPSLKDISPKAAGLIDKIKPVTDPLMKILGVDTPEGQIQAMIDLQTMGPVAPAITMVTKRPLAELQRRLHPRDLAGKAIDPAEFPQIMEAVHGATEMFPRVLSHLKGVDMDLLGVGEFGRLSVPQHVLDWIRQNGVEAWKRLNKGEVAKMRLNPVIENAKNIPGARSAADTVFHETGHLGQFIADPSRMHHTSQTAQSMLGAAANPSNAYRLDPYEVAARAIGGRGSQRLAGGRAAQTPYMDALTRELGGAMDVEAARTVASSAREAMEARARQIGTQLRPGDTRPFNLF